MVSVKNVRTRGGGRKRMVMQKVFLEGGREKGAQSFFLGFCSSRGESINYGGPERTLPLSGKRFFFWYLLQRGKKGVGRLRRKSSSLAGKGNHDGPFSCKGEKGGLSAYQLKPLRTGSASFRRILERRGKGVDELGCLGSEGLRRGVCTRGKSVLMEGPFAIGKRTLEEGGKKLHGDGRICVILLAAKKEDTHPEKTPFLVLTPEEPESLAWTFQGEKE